jgi:DnaJ-class molecular chaperone
MPAADFYKTLGVSREASADEIRKAYRKLVRKYHHDVKPDDKEAAQMFKDVQDAYAVLGDSEKRDQYDRYGAAFQGAGRGPGGQTYNWSSGPGGGGPIDLSDLFGGQVDLGDLFGKSFGRGGAGGFGAAGRQAAAPPRKGQDVRLEIDVPFQVAALGGDYTLQLQREGKTERLNVKIPAGVDAGSVIRLAGEGHPGPAGGPKGDLLLTTKIAPHPYFRRQGRNLHLEVPVTPSEAALGAKIEVPTLTEGRMTVTVPAGTSTGTKLRLRGKGIPDPKGGTPGDQFVVIKVVVPRDLDEESRSLYRKLAEADPQSPRAGLW